MHWSSAPPFSPSLPLGAERVGGEMGEPGRLGPPHPCVSRIWQRRCRAGGHAPPVLRPSDRSPSDAFRLVANDRMGAWSAAVPSFTRTIARVCARTCKAGDTRIMALQRSFVGIDVSTDWLDLWLEPVKRFERASNDAAGWVATIGLLKSVGVAAGLMVAFETTSGHERGLRQALLEAGYEVRRLNPLRVRLYARSLGRNAKNDRIDARVMPAMPRRPIPCPNPRPGTRAPGRAGVPPPPPGRRARGPRQSDRHASLQPPPGPEPQALGADRAADRADRYPHPRGDRPDPQLACQGRDAQGRQGRHGNRPSRAAARARPHHTPCRRRPGRSCPVRSRQWQAEGNTIHRRRARRGANRPLQGCPCRRPQQVSARRVLQTPHSRRETPKVATVALMRKMLVTLNAMLRDNQAWKHANAC